MASPEGSIPLPPLTHPVLLWSRSAFHLGTKLGASGAHVCVCVCVCACVWGGCFQLFLPL